ncbi:MAG TPA: hypothetical protein PLN33_14595 [Hyphomonadaceae bacterium]|nr:hypothetical protein [Hyphomonadaceae bacterium]
MTEIVPVAVDGIQINACRNTLCPQFGQEPSTNDEPKLRRRLVGYTRSGSKGIRALRCDSCKQTFLLKNNRAIAEELARMRAYLIETQQVICANETCASHDSEESACFHRFGTTSSGSARVRCKTCGKTQSFSANPTWKQKVADKNALVLSLLVNKTAMRRILEIAEIGAQTLYRKLEHFERQCLLFAASMERRLPAMSFTHLDLATDRQDYLINWGSHINRRSFSLRAAATSDRQSGFVFGIHSNFDPALGAVEVEHAARACGDLMRDVYLREHARVWLLSDYARVAESNAAVAKRDGRVNTQRQPEQAGLISDPDPFAEDYEQTAPSRGVQVRQEYVLMAHFLFLNSMLVGARRVTLFLDPDSGIRTAAMLGFHERIRAGEVDAFLVRSEKELTVNKRDTSLSQSEHRLAQFMAERPGLSRWEAGIAWLEEAFEAVLPQGLNPTPWVPHPFSDRAEPGKQISLLTPRLDSNSNRVARRAISGGLKSIDRFFMLIRRRISLLERPIRTPASASRTCHIYSPYNPIVACRLLNILRVIYNYHLAGEKDKATPAMRLGLALKRYSLAEILETPRPSKVTRQGSGSVLGE